MSEPKFKFELGSLPIITREQQEALSASVTKRIGDSQRKLLDQSYRSLQAMDKAELDSLLASANRRMPDLHVLTNVQMAPKDAVPVVMVWDAPKHQWVGVMVHDAMSDRPLAECVSFATFSQDRVEIMLSSPSVAEQVLWQAARKGVAIIDWVKREDL